MAENVTLAPLANLSNDGTAIATINANNTIIEDAFEDCLSLIGTVPNAMQSNLDMNNFNIINLPAPSTIHSPARLSDVTIAAAVPSNILNANNVFTGTNSFNGVSQFQNYLKVVGGSAPSFLDLYTSPPLNGTYISNSGALIGFHPLTYGAQSGLSQAASLYVKSTAVQSPLIAEYMVTFDSNLNSGKAPIWKPLTSYNIGDYVIHDVNLVNLYIATVGGISAASGGPTGTGTGIVDGTVTWNYAGPTFNDQKVGFFNSAVTGPLASSGSWAMANDFEILAGDTGEFKIGAEFDITNNAYDFVVGGAANAYNLLISGLTGAFPITAQVSISPTPNGSIYSAHYGLIINGLHVADSADIEISGGAAFGLSINGLIPGGHSIAAIQDRSTSGSGLNLVGTYVNSHINLGATVGLAAINQGTRACLILQGAANAVNGINIGGSATGTAPNIAATGSDSNIDLIINAKGTGQLNLGSVVHFNSTGSFTANGAIATALSSVGPTGSHTTVQEWLTFTNVAGVTRYVPCF